MQYPPYKLPFEELTTIDERVDYIHNQLVASQLALNQLLEKEALPTMAVLTKHVTLRRELVKAPNHGSGARCSDPSPLTGRIVQLIPSFDECNKLVDLAFGHGDTWVLPGKPETFIALNNVSPVLRVDEPVTKGEELWMIAKNGDSGNPHDISIDIIIVGVP